MDNFSVFNKEEIARVIEQFLPGVTPHITPISYRAWTPDIFLFLFRATNQDGEDHYFVTVSFDYLTEGRETAEDILEKWLDLKVERFYEIEGDKVVPGDAAIANRDETYMSYLVKVMKPNGLGYWTESVAVDRDSDLEAELADFPAETAREVRHILNDNQDYSVRVYVNDRGEREYFYQ